MLRDKIRNRIQEQFCKSDISEDRVNIGSFAESMKVVVEETGSSVSYKLYDFEGDKMVGSIDLSQTRSGDFEITGVAAFPKFGASMYEIAMMSVYPKGIMSDRSGNTSDEAFGVWSKFFQRDDVRKKENPDWVDFNTSTDKSFLSNIIFFKEPNSEFNNLEFHNANEDETLKINKKNSPFFNKMRKLRGYDGNKE